MKEFTNKVVLKEKKRFLNMVYIGLFLVAVCFIILFYGFFKQDNTDAISFHEVIGQNLGENKNAYVEVDSEPYKFAYYENEPNYFYFITDENYMYVARMSSSSYRKLTAKDIEEHPIKVDGMTKHLPYDIKKIALETWNENMDKEHQFTMTDFETYFGTLYIDLEANAVSTMDICILISVLFGMVGTLIVLVGLWQSRRFSKKVSKLSVEERQKIDKEMNDKDAFYYAKAHLFLTKNYAINFASTFDVIPYKDMIWIYPYELRQYGMKTNQNLRVMTKDGKTHVVATLDGITKKSKDAFEEIYTTLAQKNEHVLLGYTKENRKLVKERIQK